MGEERLRPVYRTFQIGRLMGKTLIDLGHNARG